MEEEVNLSSDVNEVEEKSDLDSDVDAVKDKSEVTLSFDLETIDQTLDNIQDLNLPMDKSHKYLHKCLS
jgi:hypothetical protein